MATTVAIYSLTMKGFVANWTGLQMAACLFFDS